MSPKYKIFNLNCWLTAASILGVFTFPYSTELSAQARNELVFKNKHSLLYEEIKESETELFENGDFNSLDLLTNIHLGKAKAENNHLEMARAYYYKYAISNSEEKLEYADSIIEITKNSSHPNYPTMGYSLKGHFYYYSGKFELALDNYLKAYQLATEKGNVSQQREISLSIAAIRNLNGQHYAAFEMYSRALKLLKGEKDYEKDLYSDYMLLLYNLSLTQLRLKQTDSARFYAAQGIDLSHLKSDDQNYRDFILLDAQINYYENDLRKATDTIEKYVDSLEGTSKAIKLYYLGKIQNQMKNSSEAVIYFKKIDSIVTCTKDEFPEVKDVYHHLILNAIEQNNKEEQIEYIDKLVYYDSVLSTSQEQILNKSALALDIPLLKQKKLEIQEHLRAKRNYKILAGFLGAVTMISGLHFFNRNRKMKRRLTLLMEVKPVRKKFSSPKSLEQSSAVPENILNDLLLKLEVFEDSDRYLDKNFDMSILANELGTNTSYLSLVINNYKGVSFPNYLKDLRISYAIQELKDNIELTKFNNQGLAEIFGFKTGESFSKAFFKKTGVHPSKFIIALKARKTGGHL